LVHHPAAEAETHRAQFARRIRTRLEPLGGRDEVFGHLLPVHLPEGRRALLVVAGIAADRGQPVGREGYEVG
jgi:hypothetical protein